MPFLNTDREPLRLVKVEQTCLPLQFRRNSYAAGTQIPLLHWESAKIRSRSDFAFPTIYFGIKSIETEKAKNNLWPEILLTSLVVVEKWLPLHFSARNRSDCFNFSWPLWQVARAVTSVEFVSKDYRQNCIKCARFALNLKENNRKVQLNRSSVNISVKCQMVIVFCWCQDRLCCIQN